MKSTFLVVLWCCVVLTNCEPDFDRALELSAYSPERPLKDAVYLSLMTLKPLLSLEEPVAQYYPDEIFVGNPPTIVFNFFRNMFDSTKPTYEIKHDEYDRIGESCAKLSDAINETLGYVKLCSNSVDSDQFKTNISNHGVKISNTLQLLKNILLEYFTKSSQLDANQLNFDNAPNQSKGMPSMSLTNAVDFAFSTCNRAIELREMLKDNRFDEHDTRSTLQIMPVFRFLVFFYYCIDPRDISIQTNDFDFIVTKCQSILFSQKKILGGCKIISGGGYYPHYYITDIKPNTDEMRLQMDEIIFKLLELYPQLAENFKQLTLRLKNDCIKWRNKIGKDFFAVAPGVDEFKGLIVDIAEYVGKIDDQLATSNRNNYVDILEYIAMNYPFVVGTIYLIGEYFDQPYLEWQSPDEETISKIKEIYASMSKNIANSSNTIRLCQKTAKRKGFDELENRVQLRNTIKENQEMIAIEFYNIFDYLLPLLPESADVELETKRRQHIAVIKELKEFREDVKLKEDKKRKHGSTTQDDTSAN